MQKVNKAFRSVYTYRIGSLLGAVTIILEVGLGLGLVFVGHLQLHLKDTIFFAAGTFVGIIAILLWRDYEQRLKDTATYQEKAVSGTALIQAGGAPAPFVEKSGEDVTVPQINVASSSSEVAHANLQAQLQQANVSEVRNQPAISNIRMVQGVYVQKSQLRPFPQIHEFVFPKEGDNPERSQDKFAYCIDDHLCRIAIADGVSASFLPSSWAQIVANNFVQQLDDFQHPTEFTAWLGDCSQEWYQWVNEQWIPAANQQFGREKNWSYDRARGAQTTLVGYSLSPQALLRDGSTEVRIFGVGDAMFFLVHPPEDQYGNWMHSGFFCDSSADFGPIPKTLSTAEAYIEQAWTLLDRGRCTASIGDYIFLVTDALAKWILMQVERGYFPWPDLLALSEPEAFRDFVLRERSVRSLEVDDTSLLIAHLT